MFWFNGLLLLVYLSSVIDGLLERPSNLPCKLDDNKCVSNVTQWLVNTTIEGIPEEGIEGVDPLYHDIIDGHLGYLKYTLKKSHVVGMKTCKANKASLNSNATSMHVELLCRRTHMDGEYDIEGQLLSFPIKGKGIFNIDSTNFQCQIDIGISYFEREKKLYAKHEKFTYKCELLGELDMDLKTLDGNAKKISDTVQTIIRLAKENAKLFSSLVDDPVHSRNINKLVKTFNKRLGLIPITDIFQVDRKSLKLEKV